MGWESLHLFEFRIRAVRYGSSDICPEPPDKTLESFAFRKNARFAYVYDMGDWWEHEIRVEDREVVKERGQYPACIGGAGACPPEDCGGPDRYLQPRDDAFGLDAMDDIATMAEFVEQVVLVGKSIPEDRENRYFGLVQSHDDKPRRRLREVLREQGFQMNQDITFLTDGGDSVRNMAVAMSPCAEHVLDWLHIPMRLTVLGRYAKGLAHHNPKEAEDIARELKRIKGFLWNGNHRQALPCIEWLVDDLDVVETDYPSMKALRKVAEEFHTYIANNAGMIPNYAEMRRYGERISTAFVESTVNVVVGKRFSKRQQMRWSKAGAHLLLQIRTHALDGTLRGKFEQWYPGLAANNLVHQMESPMAA